MLIVVITKIKKLVGYDSTSEKLTNLLLLVTPNKGLI